MAIRWDVIVTPFPQSSISLKVRVIIRKWNSILRRVSITMVCQVIPDFVGKPLPWIKMLRIHCNKLSTVRAQFRLGMTHALLIKGERTYCRRILKIFSPECLDFGALSNYGGVRRSGCSATIVTECSIQSGTWSTKASRKDVLFRQLTPRVGFLLSKI